MGPKHLKHPPHQAEYRKDNEQRVPQFIIEILSFMTTATCQFTGCSRNRNNKDFLVLLDMVERLHESSPSSNSADFHRRGHCIDDCTTGQWVVLLSCGHVHHHVCHHAATRNNVFHACPSCGNNQTSPQTVLQARCPSPRGPTIICLGNRADAIFDMTTIARAHRCTPTLMFIAATPRQHEDKCPQKNNNHPQTTWGDTMHMPDIWTGSM